MYIFAIILFFVIALIEAIFISTHSRKYIIIRYTDAEHTKIDTVYLKCFYDKASASLFAYTGKLIYYEIEQIR